MLLLSSLDFYQKKKILQKILIRKTIRESNGLEPDQNRLSVSPDLGPVCLRRLSADDKVAAIKDRVECLC